MCVLPACMSVYHIRVCCLSVEDEEGVGSLGNGFLGSCELPDLELDLGPLQELHQALEVLFFFF